MSRLVPARSTDLSATIAATLVAIGVALVADSGPLATAALLPLVLVLPGYAVAAALFPPRTIDRDSRIVLVVALSIGATALSGLVLQLFVDLSRAVFAVSLATVTIGAALVAGRERARRTRRPISLGRLPRLPPASLLAMVAAIAISVVAIAIATAGAKRQLSDSHFSGLWLVPKGMPGFPPNGPPLVLGVSNHEGREVGYRLSVRQGTSTLGVWRLRLPAGDEWGATLTASELPGDAPLVARLDREGTVYRRVALELDPRIEGVAGG